VEKIQSALADFILFQQQIFRISFSVFLIIIPKDYPNNDKAIARSIYKKIKESLPVYEDFNVCLTCRIYNSKKDFHSGADFISIL
jgi:hypothetical protein